MKKSQLLSFCIAILFAIPCFSQADITSMGFSYSALVRDTAGHVQPNKPVTIRFTILQNQTSSQSSVNNPWSETQAIQTDAYGFANATIGIGGTQVGGTAASFSAIDFTAGNYWLLIEVYNTFTKVYDALAKQALQAVPYAKVAGALTASGGGVPTGTIVAYGGSLSSIPAGWEPCGGQSHSPSDPKYINLFNAINYYWGKTTTGDFVLPYTNGMFLRGVAQGATWDPDRNTRNPIAPGSNHGDAVGSLEYDAFQGHLHSALGTAFLTVSGSGGAANGSSAIGEYNTTGAPFTDGIHGIPSISSETRPVNINVYYIIKL